MEKLYLNWKFICALLDPLDLEKKIMTENIIERRYAHGLQFVDIFMGMDFKQKMSQLNLISYICNTSLNLLWIYN